MQVRKLRVIPEKCTACRLCELACSFRFTGEFNPVLSKIHPILFLEDAFYLPVVCLQCDDAPCAKACPSGALKKNEETGVVEVLKERCIGCRMCVLACPFGCVDVVDGKSYKCDLCDGDPECVKYCLAGALVYEEEEVTVPLRKKSLAMKIKEAFKEVS